MTIYCPKCNRSSDEIGFVGEFCHFCIAEKLKKNLPEIVKIYQCRFCNRIKIVNTFFEESNSTLARAVEIATKLDCRVKVLELRNGIANCRLKCRYQDGKIVFEQKFKIKILHETCQKCYRMSAGYYQAVVQLRGNRMKMERIVERLKRYVERRGGFITKTENVLNGVDIYVSDKEITNSFFMQWDIKPERSFRLYGMKKGKKIYRNTYALHL